MADAFPSVTQFNAVAATFRYHFLGKRSSRWHCAFCSAVTFNIVAVYLQSILTDEKISPMVDAFTSVTQFDAVAASSQLRVFLGKKISDGIALVIWQFNSILMLYFCNLSSLMKKSLSWLMLFLQQLSLTLLLRLRSLSMKNSSQCAFYIVACCAFAIFLHR